MTLYNTTPLADAAANTAEQVGHAAAHTTHLVRDRVLPGAARLATQAEDLAHRGVGAVRHGSQQLRERAHDASDRGINYVREEPVKAVLIAAAAGAAVMLLANLLSQRRG